MRQNISTNLMKLRWSTLRSGPREVMVEDRPQQQQYPRLGNARSAMRNCEDIILRLLRKELFSTMSQQLLPRRLAEIQDTSKHFTDFWLHEEIQSTCLLTG